MKGHIKTLIVYANGYPHWRTISEDTILRGILRLRDEDAASLGAKQWLARRLQRRYETLSYMQDWQDAFCAAPQLNISSCNILNLVDLIRAQRSMTEYDLIVVLHSAAGDDLRLLRRIESIFSRRRGKLLVLLGNEYDLMPDKIGFLQAVEADYIGSQLPVDAARWLYHDCPSVQVLPAPHALNPEAYFQDAKSLRRKDIGFIGTIYPYFIGDIERTRMIQFFKESGSDFGLTCDIREERLSRSEWARFLNECKGIIGAESGTFFLERSDRTKNAVQDFLNSYPHASFDEVEERFFKGYPNPVSGKAISSRHFEPIGTQTCQILLEGCYNGILIPDKHYISLKKDFSNILDVVERFKDESYRSALVRQALEYVLAGHTHHHRVKFLIDAMFGANELQMTRRDSGSLVPTSS